MENFVELGLYLSYALVILAAVGAIVLPLIGAMSQPKALIKGLIGVAGLVVVFLIAWAVAGGEVTPMYVEKGINGTSSKLVGGAITTFYFLMGIALVGIVYTEIAKILK